MTSTSASAPTKTKTTSFSGFAQVQPKSRKAWRAWLEKHHVSSPGVWLVYAKKHTGIPSLTYNDAVEEALCFGWIDSLLHPVDDKLFKQVFTPRKPKSVWSALNRTRVAKLIAAGSMSAAGMAMVTVAKKTGTWEALKHIEALEPPEDLAKAITANAAAQQRWPDCPPGMRKTFLYWLNNAKRPETRAIRIGQIVNAVARGVTMADLRAGKWKLP